MSCTIWLLRVRFVNKVYLSRVLVVKNLPASAEDIRDRVRFLGQEDALEEGMATHSVFLPGESHGQRSLAGYCP